MSIDKSFTDNLIKRLYQIDKDTSIDLQFNRGELEHIIKQSRKRTLEEIKEIIIQMNDSSKWAQEQDIAKYINTELKKMEE